MRVHWLVALHLGKLLLLHERRILALIQYIWDVAEAWLLLGVHELSVLLICSIRRHLIIVSLSVLVHLMHFILIIINSVKVLILINLILGLGVIRFDLIHAHLLQLLLRKHSLELSRLSLNHLVARQTYLLVIFILVQLMFKIDLLMLRRVINWLFIQSFQILLQHRCPASLHLLSLIS